MVLVIILLFLFSWKIECFNKTVLLPIVIDFPENFSSPSLSQDFRNACVFLSNKNSRTASFFELNIMHIHGNAPVKYLINSNREFKKVCAKNDKTVAYYNIEVVGVKETGSDFTNTSIKAALSSRPLKRVVTGDEGCDCKYSHCGIFPNKRSIIAREYFSETFMPKWEFLGSSKPSQSIVYIPLGPRFDYGLSPWGGSDNTTSTRKWLFNLIISSTSDSRKKLFSSVKSQTFAKQLGGSLPYVANMAHSWHGTSGSNHTDLINSTTYKQILQNSIFTLCPAGKNSVMTNAVKIHTYCMYSRVGTYVCMYVHVCILPTISIDSR